MSKSLSLYFDTPELHGHPLAHEKKTWKGGVAWRCPPELLNEGVATFLRRPGRINLHEAAIAEVTASYSELFNQGGTDQILPVL